MHAGKQEQRVFMALVLGCPFKMTTSLNGKFGK